MKLIWRMEIGDEIWRISLEIALLVAATLGRQVTQFSDTSIRRCRASPVAGLTTPVRIDRVPPSTAPSLCPRRSPVPSLPRPLVDRASTFPVIVVSLSLVFAPIHTPSSGSRVAAECLAGGAGGDQGRLPCPWPAFFPFVLEKACSCDCAISNSSFPPSLSVQLWIYLFCCTLIQMLFRPATRR
jgi:hypothetical protein